MKKFSVLAILILFLGIGNAIGQEEKGEARAVKPKPCSIIDFEKYKGFEYDGYGILFNRHICDEKDLKELLNEYKTRLVHIDKDLIVLQIIRKYNYNLRDNKSYYEEDEKLDDPNDHRIDTESNFSNTQ